MSDSKRVKAAIEAAAMVMLCPNTETGAPVTAEDAKVQRAITAVIRAYDASTRESTAQRNRAIRELESRVELLESRGAIGPVGDAG